MSLLRSLSGILLMGVLAPAWAGAPVMAELPDPNAILTSHDWPWWRGPHRNGVALPDQSPPTQWSASENVIWKAPVPGRGHSSATLVGDQLFLTTADEREQTQSVLCYDRRDGSLQWQQVVHRGGLVEKMNSKASHASSTVACDGTRLFVNFVNRDAMFTTALTRDGQQLWQTKISDYTTHQGYGASPAIYGPLVIVSADNKGGGAIAGLHRGTGEMVWKRERPELPNYASPIILHAAGRDQLVFTGCDLVSSFDPTTGKTLWEIAGATTECVTSTVTDGQLIFTSGGYPENHMSAVRADGSGEVVWRNNTRLYVPSMLYRDGYLYAVLDAGVAACWEAATGKLQWRSRLGGTFSASPVLVGDRIYATNEEGTTFIFRAQPKSLERIAENTLGTGVMATPTICDSRLYLRVNEVTEAGTRQVLYCIGQR